MPALPFTPSRNNYRLEVPISGARYLFDVHWNARDLGWYFDLREGDETPILLGIKVVLGVAIGKSSPHPFFEEKLIQAIDTTSSGVDAGYDDLGDRIQVIVTTADDVA